MAKTYKKRDHFPGLNEGYAMARMSAQQAGQALLLVLAERDWLRSENHRLHTLLEKAENKK